jgi:hypothetical protein
MIEIRCSLYSYVNTFVFTVFISLQEVLNRYNPKSLLHSLTILWSPIEIQKNHTPQQP